MQKKLNKLKELYNEVIELLILEDFKAIIPKIKIIQKIISNIEFEASSWEQNNKNKPQEKQQYFILEKRIKTLEERVLKLEKMKNPSMQIINKSQDSTDKIWN